MKSRRLPPGHGEPVKPAEWVHSRRTRSAGPPASPSQKSYRLIFFNESTNSGSVCLFQAPVEVNLPPHWSLAWLVQHTHPTTRVEFQWTLDYCFFWSRRGKAGSGSEMFQIRPADLGLANRVTLHHDRAYDFIDPGCPRDSGTLYIDQDHTIPLRQAWVGIGMSGAPTHAVQAQPNLNLAFTPSPDYWITFGRYERSDRMELSKIATAARVVFPPNEHTLTVVLHQDNTWTVVPGEI